MSGVAADTATEIAGARVRLRRLRADDVPRLVSIGAEPEVARWWPGIDEAELRKKVGADGDAVAFTVLHDGDVIGLAQYWEEDDPEFRHAGIDLFLSTTHHGRGLGRDVVQVLAGHLVRARGHHRVTIDPAAANERAVRCYEAVGFKRVGILRRYWLGPDGEWHDGLLLDLLADEI